jgi:hypothetical protein
MKPSLPVTAAIFARVLSSEMGSSCPIVAGSEGREPALSRRYTPATRPLLIRRDLTARWQDAWSELWT